MNRLRSPAEIGAVVDRFLAVHPEGGPAEISSWIQSDPELSSDPEFAADLEGAIRAVLSEAPGLDAAVTERLPRERSLPRDVRPGEVLGRFELLEPIARGGMGEVWRAQDRELNRLVALKLVLPERVSARSREMLRREARAGGRLAHPHVVATYDHGEDRGIAWIAQELVADAGTLRDFLSSVSAEPTVPHGHDRAVAELVAKIADGIEATHAAGIVHRDLKPSNILICRGDYPKITDFGLARIEEEAALSHTGEVAGTWAYMSPEQIRGGRDGVDYRSDLFSLGSLLYELIARQRPFRGDTGAEIAEQILHAEPAPIRSVRPQCPLDLALICHKALEKKPGDRYQSAAALAADLRRFLAHEPIHAKAPSLPRRAAKWVRRHPTASLTTGVGLVAFSITAWFAFDNARLLAESKRQEGIAGIRATEAVEAAAEARAQTVRAEAALARAEQLLGERDAALSAERERAEELALVVGFQQEQLGSIDPQGMGVTLRERLLELHGSGVRRGNAEPDGVLAEQLRGLDFTGLSLDVVGDALFGNAVAAIDSRFGANPRIRARLLESVAVAMGEVGLLRQAVDTQIRALQILGETAGEDLPRLLDARVKLAGLYLEMKDYASALDIADATAASWRALGAEGEARALHAARVAANARLGAGQSEAALASLRQLRARLMEVNGPTHEATRRTTVDLALALKRAGSSAESEQVLREVLDATPSGDPMRLSILHNLATTLSDAKRSAEAVPLFEEVLAARRQELGDRHPNTLATAQNLAGAYLDAGRIGEAETLIREVLSAYAETLGLEHERSWLAANTLGSILKTQGRHVDAEPVFRDALAGMRASLGETHPQTLSVKSNLGLVLVALERPTEALELLRAARDGFVAVAGPGHPAVFVAWNNLAMAHKALGELDEAERLYRASWEGSRARLGEEHRSTLAAMNNLAVVLVERNQLDDAGALLRDALRIKRRTLGDGHPSTLLAAHGLGGLLARQGRNDESEDLFREALAGRVQVLGHDHPATVETVQALARYRAAIAEFDQARSGLSEWLEKTSLLVDDSRVVAIRAQLQELEGRDQKVR